MEPSESLFWADQIARIVKQRVENEPTLQKIVKKNGYICYDEKTPSGRIHIGSGRGWVIHDTVAKALRGLGLKGVFILSSDDMDPLDSIPPGLDRKTYEPLMGVPMKNVPSPVEGYKSFAEYYFLECVEKFPDFGIDAKIERTSQRYENGDFNPFIKLALDNAEKIQGIYEEVYGKKQANLPFNPICEGCGKIGTTIAYEWDPEREIVKYRCSPDLVKWAKGCGFEGETSPYNGEGKLPWKVEWAAKWPAVGVVFETAGKDHFTKRGSRDIAVRICSGIFDYPPPYPSSRTEIGRGYEFFTVGGAKMSTSKGIGFGFREIADMLSCKILRYLLVRTRPHAAIDFDPQGTNKMLLLYDNYDRTERIYFGKEKAAEKDERQEKRIYELSHIGNIPRKLPPQTPLAFASMAIQTADFDTAKAIQILQRTGRIGKKITKEEKSYLEERLKDAASWVKTMAPEEYRFAVAEKPALKPSGKQKEMIRAMAETLDSGVKDEKEMENRIYEAIKKKGFDPKEFFKTVYLALLGKEHGPRLAPLILAAGVERVRGVLDKID